VKYVLMFTSTPELDEAMDPARAQEVYGRLYEWFGANADKFADISAELQPVTTATTVTHGDAGPVDVDGPFSEAKEVVGGCDVIDVPDLDEAIALTRTWPALETPGVSVEIRPMVVDYSQFEQ